MANLANKDGVYLARFRYRGREYKKSLKTRDAAAAKAGINIVELTIHRLLTGQLQIPADVDRGDLGVNPGRDRGCLVHILANSLAAAQRFRREAYQRRSLRRVGSQHGRRGVFAPSPALGLDFRDYLNLGPTGSLKLQIGLEQTGRDNLTAA
jgi:hypothetical protein